MILEKNKIFKIINFLLIIVFLFSSSVLEDSLLINLFSITVLLSIFFVIRVGRRNILREIRKHIKLTYRIQKLVLKRSYFIFLTVIKLKLKYLKKLTKKYFSIKYNRLILLSHLKLKFFFFKLIFFKLYLLNLISKLVFSISFNILTVF